MIIKAPIGYFAKVRFTTKRGLLLVYAQETFEAHVPEIFDDDFPVSVRWRSPRGSISEIRHDDEHHFKKANQNEIKNALASPEEIGTKAFAAKINAWRARKPVARNAKYWEKDVPDYDPANPSPLVASVEQSQRDDETTALQQRAGRLVAFNGEIWVPLAGPPAFMAAPLLPCDDPRRMKALAVTDVTYDEGISIPVNRSDMLDAAAALIPGLQYRDEILFADPSLLPSEVDIMRAVARRLTKDLRPIPAKVSATNKLRTAIEEGDPQTIFRRIRELAAIDAQYQYEADLLKFERVWSSLLELPEPELSTDADAILAAGL